jgi:EmrB/QacA subfamily drug resistance transporter
VSGVEQAAAVQENRTAVFDAELRRLSVVVVLGVVMSILDTTVLNVAINTLGRDFHTSLSTIQWVLTGYALALSMTIPITGWVVERLGAKTTWLASLVLFIAGSVLSGVAWSVPALITFRVLQGVGGGLLLPVGQTMLARVAGPQRMGRVMGVVAIPAMIAPVLGPVVGGLIVDHLSWRWLFYVNAPFCAIALAAAVAWLPRDTDRSALTRLDVLGLALLSPGLAALVYGVSKAGNGASLTGAQVLIGAVGGVALIVAFAVHALRTRRRPLIDLRQFRVRSFRTANATTFIYSVALFGLMVLLPLYFQLVHGDSPLRAGMMLAPLGLGAMLTLPISGRLTDRVGSRVLAMTGISVVLLGMLAYTRLNATTGVALLAVALFVIGLGHGMMMPSLMAAMYQGLPKAAIPTATTTFNILARVGSSFGIAVLAVVLQSLVRADVPGAGDSLAAAARLHDPRSVELLANAFGNSVWWAMAFGGAAFLAALTLPGRARRAAE